MEPEKIVADHFKEVKRKNTGEKMKASHIESLMGQVVTLFCCRYIYSGKLASIDDKGVCLEDAGIVYETGPLTSSSWQDRQPLPNKWFVMFESIESFGILK